ncbi:peroxiredoxin-like family protein [Nocardia brasiliensis]|uniref:peroxiredoxin-like family protein n=1 Tax=Nocardia brasiliensis TaxID=37326 RepID=UPI0004A6AAA6|nr:peroxiredoxin-like family protein [Nocardia brasiliensis]MBF6546149.1 AhpC/TSA family protein [Nocardia brasiliensis]
MPLPTTVADRVLTTVTDRQVYLPDPNRLIHLQFRRFAGCPVCHLHLRSIVTRHDEITAANIREVVVFHSSATELRKYTEGLPLDFVADPGKQLYRDFGVESSPRALLDPRGWPGIVRGLTSAAVATLRHRQPTPPTKPEGGSLGLPADFLIAPDGRVLAAKHGTHVDDQWSVDELLALVPARKPLS